MVRGSGGLSVLNERFVPAGPGPHNACWVGWEKGNSGREERCTEQVGSVPSIEIDYCTSELSQNEGNKWRLLFAHETQTGGKREEEVNETNEWLRCRFCRAKAGYLDLIIARANFHPEIIRPVFFFCRCCFSLLASLSSRPRAVE